MYRIRYLLIATALAITSVVTAQKANAEQLIWLDGYIAEAQSASPGRLSIDVSSLSTGLHWITFSEKNEAGVWSAPLTKAFLVPYKGTECKSIVEHEYWIDGQFTARVNQSYQPSTIDVKDLAPGFHTLTIRIKDNSGAWSSQITKHFIVPENRLDLEDKKIVEHQYWLDGRMEASVTQGQVPSAINVSSLAPGIHTLTIRIKDNDGMWSSHITKNFIVPENRLALDNKQIVAHQYWIDGRMEASVTSDKVPSAIDVSALAPGIHTLTIRIKDNDGMWSSHITKNFIVPNLTVEDKKIVLHEYWIDGQIAAAVAQGEQPSIINIDNLSSGMHSFTVRAKDNAGLWSSQVSKYFVYNGNALEETTVTRCLYWFDDDIANMKAVPVVPESNAIALDISEVETGTHTLWWRCGNANGVLSAARSVTFESISLIKFTVPDNGLGTFSANYNMTLPDGLKAYFCTETEAVADGRAVKILSVDGNVINGGTGVLLSGTPGQTYSLHYTEEAGAATEGNSLVAVVESTDIPAVFGECVNFTMQAAQFAKVEGSVTMPANSAYLQRPSTEVGDATVITFTDPDAITQDSDGYYLIATPRHWKEFSRIVATNAYANARMVADVDLGADQSVIGSTDSSASSPAFSGIFDGQGHTLTVAYTDLGSETVHGPFAKINGATIKNLHVKGTLTTSGFHPTSVVADSWGTSTLQQVWGEVDIVSTRTGNLEAAGLVGCMKAGQLTITDCMFTGTVNGAGSYNGCFIGFIDSGTATVTNCLSTGEFTYSGGDTGFRGSYTNCYAKSFPASYPTGVQDPSNESLADGTLAAALQAGRGKQVWVQDDKLGIPVLAVFKGGHSLSYETTYTIYFDTFRSAWTDVKLYKDGVEVMGTLVKVPYIRGGNEDGVEGYLHKFTVNVTDVSQLKCSSENLILRSLPDIKNSAVYFVSNPLISTDITYSSLENYRVSWDERPSYRLHGTILGDGSEGTYRMVYSDGLWIYEGDNFVPGSFYIMEFGPNTPISNPVAKHYAKKSGLTEVKVGETTGSLRYDAGASGAQAEFTSNITGKCTLVFNPKNRTVMFINPVGATANHTVVEAADGSHVNKMNVNITASDYTAAAGPFTISNGEYTTTSADGKFTNLPYATNYTLTADDGTAMPITIDLPVEPVFDITAVNANVVAPVDPIENGILAVTFPVSTTWSYNKPHVICTCNGVIVEGEVEWAAGGFAFIASNAVPIFDYTVADDITFEFVIVPEYPFMVNAASTRGKRRVAGPGIQPVLGTAVPAIATISGGSSVSGVGNVSIDAQDTTVEYYNLQGQRVNATSLTPGIYIRRTPTKTDKIIVR